MSNGFINPEQTPVDIIELSGIPSPGYCEILGLERKDRLQVLAGLGYNDSVVHWTGYEPIEFSVKLHLFDVAIYNDYQTGAFKRLLYKKNKDVTSYDIVHPFVNDPIFNVHSVWIKSVKGPERNGETGEWTVDIVFVSGSKAKQAPSAIERSAATPTDATERQIQAAQAEQNRLKALRDQKTAAPK